VRGTGGLGAPRPLPEPGSGSSSCPKHCRHLSELGRARTGRGMNGQRGLMAAVRREPATGFLKPRDSSARPPEPALGGRGIRRRETVSPGNKASEKADPVGWLRPPERGTGVSGAGGGGAGAAAPGWAPGPQGATQNAGCVTG